MTLILSGSTYAACQAPGQSFLEQKLKESFSTEPAEKELREVVKDPRNYALREEVKSLDRRSKLATRLQLSQISSAMNQKFNQMIETTNRGEEISDFPTTGAISKISGTTDSMAMEISNLSKEDLDVIPPKVLEKLSNKVKIHYKYPYDKFDYFLTYDGREYPMEKALNKLQADFEDACEERTRENQNTEGLWELDRKIRGYSPLQKGGSGSTGGSKQ